MKNEKYISTKAELAKSLKISRPTLNRYLNLPGAPQRTVEGWGLDAVVEHVARNTPSELTGGKIDLGIRQLKVRELGLRCERMRLNLDILKGKYIERQKSDEWFLICAKEACSIFYQKLVNEMPAAVAGVDVPS